MVLFLLTQVVVMQFGLPTQVAIIISQLVAILGGAYVYRKKFALHDTKWPTLGKLGMSPKALVVVLGASISLGFLANVVGAFTLQLFPGFAEMARSYQEQIEVIMLPEALWGQVLGAVAVAVVAPIAEEYLFRGTILAEQRRSQLAVGAILLNGVLFSAMHLNPVAFLSLTIVGCYFAHITVRSDALWGAVLGHGILNLVNGVILIRVAGDLGSPDDITWTEVGIGLALLVPLTSLLWWWSIKLIRQSKSGADDHS